MNVLCFEYDIFDIYFPEVQEIGAILTSRFGKEFAVRAIVLRKNCGVHPRMIQKLSPSVGSRMTVLKGIATEIEADPFVKELVFDESDNETDEEQKQDHFFKHKSSRYHAGKDVGSGVLNEVPGSKMQSAPHLVDLEKRPLSVTE